MLDAPCGLGTLAMETGHGLASGKVWDVDLSQIPPQNSTLNTAVMAEKYGLAALPLPQNWQSAVGQEYTDAFLTELK